MIVPSNEDAIDEIGLAPKTASFNRSSSFSKSVAEPPQIAKVDSVKRVNSSGLVNQLSGGLLGNSTTKNEDKDNTPKLKLKGFADWRDRGIT